MRLRPPLAALLGAIALVSAAHAGAILPAQTRPLTTVGGVLALPLTGAPDRWPETLLLQRQDGGKPVEGVVAWVGAMAPALERSWTTPEESLDVRPVARAPQGRAPSESGAVLLLAALPPDLHGPLSLDGTTIEPSWMPLAQPHPDASLPMVPPADAGALDRPPLDSPGEWFRWWLLADERRAAPPPPVGDPVASLFALHRAQLWQAGLDRVERISPGVARELRERLTATVSDTRGGRSVPMAAWMARAEELAFTLATLLDLSRTDEQVMQALLTRLRADPPLTCWVEADSGSSMRLAVANGGREALTLQATWLESPATPPTVIPVPAAGLSRHVIERPAELLPDALTRNAAPLGGSLMLRCGAWQLRLPVGPAQVIPRPPGYGLGVLRPPLTLSDAQRLRMAPPPAEWCTTASLRRNGPRWEIFAECLRPAAGELDTLEVVVGEARRGLVRVVVREQGEPVVEGPPGLDAPVITRGSFADRWRAVIEVPTAWVEPPSTEGAVGARGAVLMLGVARSPAGAGTRQTGALAVPSWMPVPVLSLDPTGWWVPGAAREARPVPAVEAPGARPAGLAP